MCEIGAHTHSRTPLCRYTTVYVSIYDPWFIIHTPTHIIWCSVGTSSLINHHRSKHHFPLTTDTRNNNKTHTYRARLPAPFLVFPAEIPCPKHKQETMANINVRRQQQRRRSPSSLWPATTAAAAVALLIALPTALAHTSHSHHHDYHASSSSPHVAHTHHQGKLIHSHLSTHFFFSLSIPTIHDYQPTHTHTHTHTHIPLPLLPTHLNKYKQPNAPIATCLPPRSCLVST